MQPRQDGIAGQLAASITPVGERGAGAILAFDFGEKRIGVAVGNTELSVAHPLAHIGYTNKDDCFKNIGQLIEKWQPVVLVVGLPVHADGTEHGLTEKSRRFARRLEGRFDIKTVLIDERHTSIDAGITLREAGVRGKKQKFLVDSVAAQLILQDYFDKLHAIT